MTSTGTDSRLKLAVLGSGRGTNLQSIMDACAGGAIPVQVVCVLSDVKDAYILERARHGGIPAEFVDAGPFRTKLEGAGEKRYIERLRHYGAEAVALAGFMRIVKRGLLDAFRGRILNIHPALLPAFPGLESWKQALDYGAKVAGCTVHLVDEGTDTGPIVVQRAVPVLEDDTPETLHARIQEQEHIAYPEALRALASRRVRIEGRRVRMGQKA
ncbi:MAG: phosphoribosylglycinamide formyltransferase [Lentisphaerae bacterium]|nr:phosphoribosylglycinamide formyltransferase [Lentisphaerota bacterium]